MLVNKIQIYSGSAEGSYINEQINAKHIDTGNAKKPHLGIL